MKKDVLDLPFRALLRAVVTAAEQRGFDVDALLADVEARRARSEHAESYSDSELRELLERSMRVADTTPVPAISVRVRREIERRIHAGEALSLVKCAALFGVSTRTLQDRLQHEGVAFQDLLRDVRESEARTLLNGTARIRDIAIRLDYADVRAFRRAFKRWTGVTPSDFRRRAEEEARTPSQV